MSKPSTLIVKTTRSAMLTARDKKIADLDEKKQLHQWSDTAVESKTELFIFKVISIDFKYALDLLKGYDNLKADELIAELDEAIKALKSLAYPKKEESTPPANAAPEAQNEPSGAAKVDNGGNSENNENDDSKNKIKKDDAPF